MVKNVVDDWNQALIEGFIPIEEKENFPEIVNKIKGEYSITLHSDCEFPYVGKIFPENDSRYNLKTTDRDLFLNYNTLEKIFILNIPPLREHKFR